MISILDQVLAIRGSDGRVTLLDIAGIDGVTSVLRPESPAGLLVYPIV